MTPGSNFWPCTGSSRTGLSNGVWNLEIGPVVWEISGGALCPPPPSRTCYYPDPSGARVNPRPAGGPLWFFASNSWSTGNFVLKLAIPFRATIPHLVSKSRTQVIIGQPWVTSEWRHVPPILTNNKGWQETPPRAQFLSYDQLSHMIWRINSGTTKLLSRIVNILNISKISKKYPFFIFEKNPLKTKFFKNPCNMLEGNGW